MNRVAPANPDRPVLAVVVEYGELPELLRVADALRTRLGRPVVVFFAKRNYRRLEIDSAAVLARGHRWMDWQGHLRDQPSEGLPATAEEHAAPRHEPRPGPIVRPSSWVARFSVPFAMLGQGLAHAVRELVAALRRGASDCRSVVRQARRFRDRYGAMAAILRDHDPELVVVGQDLVGQELSFALLAARRAGVATMIVPFAMFSLRELAEYALARPAHDIRSSAANRVLAAIYPHWVLAYGERRLLRLPGPSGLALELGGLIRGHPWVPCSEPVDCIACDSEVSRGNLIALGLPEARLRVIGAPVHDELARAVAAGSEGRRALHARHGLAGDLPLVVCGWPANIFPWLGGRRIDYPDYDSLATAWAAHLAGVRRKYALNVLLTIHPKTVDSEMAAASLHRLPYQRGATEELVAHCDLFVTLNGSSITAWAIACGKPVLLFDCYQTRYTDFYAAPGCVMTRDEETFAAELDRLCAQPETRSALARAQAAVAVRWGVLDGRSSDRLVGVAHELIAARASDARHADPDGE